MRKNDFLYHCPICINDFTDEGVKPFQCLHLLCVDCDERLKSSTLNYICPLCKSNSNSNIKHEFEDHDKFINGQEFEDHNGQECDLIVYTHPNVFTLNPNILSLLLIDHYVLRHQDGYDIPLIAHQYDDIEIKIE